MGKKENGRTYKTRGVNEAALRIASRMTHRDMDPQGYLTPEVVRGFIASAMCPYCTAGPFKTLAGHTNRAHGIDRHELRVAAHLSEAQPISSPEVRRAAQARAKRYGFGTGHVDASAAGKKARSKGQGTPTAAGRDRRLQNIARVTASMTPDAYKAARRKAWRTTSEAGRGDDKVAALHRAKGNRTPADVERIVAVIARESLGYRTLTSKEKHEGRA